MLHTVPEELKQKFTKCKFRKDDVNLKIVTNDNDSEEISNSKFLKRCTGERLPFLAIFSRNILKLRNTETDEAVATQGFEKGWEVVDIDYLPSTDGQCGFLVGLNDITNSAPYPAMVVLLAYNHYQLTEVASMAISNEISCLKVLICDEVMQELKDGLHPRMAKWPHIFAVGTNPAHCYIAAFPESCRARQRSKDTEKTLQTTLTDGLRSFIDTKRGTFKYESDSMKKDINKNLHDVFVSSVGFVHRSRDLLIGLSFGGIVTISLSPKASIASLQFVSANPVRHFVALEPDDDPRCHQFFLAFIDKPQGKQLGFVLYEGAVPDEEHLQVHERTFAGVQYSVRLWYSVPMSAQWISAHILVRESGKKTTSNTSLCDTSILETSRLGTETESDRSLVFFTFLDGRSRLMGGLFDINQYYYKRLLPSIEPDRTLARQNPFMSLIWPCVDEDVHNKGVILDVTPGRIMRRFQSNISTSEQMFYPSSFEIPCLHVATSSCLFQMSLSCLANQVVKTICHDIDTHLADSQKSCSWLSAIGLTSTDVLDKDRKILDLSDFLRTLICHGDEIETVFAFTHAIKRMTDESLVLEISEWAWCEVDRARQKMDEITLSLFSKIASHLSPEQKRLLSYIKTVFIGAKIILEECTDALSRIDGGSPNAAAVTNLKARALAVDFLVSFVSSIYNLLSRGFLPLRDSSKAIRNIMEREVSNRRQKAKETGKTLNIDAIVGRIYRVSHKEPFWLDFGPEKWYPPVLHNALLPMLTVSLSSTLKKQLLIYFSFDYVNSKHKAEKGEAMQWNVLRDAVILLLHNVLNATAADVVSTHDLWLQDTDCPGQHIDENSQWNVLSKGGLVAVLEGHIEKYLNIHPLSREEELKFNELLDTHEFGKFIKQVYLFKHRQYSEIDLNLCIPARKDKWVDNYITLRDVAKKLSLGNKVQAVDVSTPLVILNVLENAPGRHSSPVKRLNLQPKTPMPLWKISQESRLGKRKCDEMKQDDSNQKTMESNSESILRTPEMEMSKLPADILNGISSVLHTPTSRARAAAKAEHQLSFDVTPECERNIANPTSILKSAKKGEHTSPSRPKKFRFDLPDVSPRLDFSAAESPEVIDVDSASDSTLPIEQEDEQSVVINTVVEEQPEAEDDIAALDTHTRTAKCSSLDDNQQSGPSVKLVDYSLNESTIMESPSNCRTWVTDDGMQHSFEEQPDEDNTEQSLMEPAAIDNDSPVGSETTQDEELADSSHNVHTQDVEMLDHTDFDDNHTDFDDNTRLLAGNSRNDVESTLQDVDSVGVTINKISEEEQPSDIDDGETLDYQERIETSSVEAIGKYNQKQDVTILIERTTVVLSPKKVISNDHSNAEENISILEQTFVVEAREPVTSEPSTSRHDETVNLDVTDIMPVVKSRRASSVVYQPLTNTRRRTASTGSDSILTTNLVKESKEASKMLPIMETPKSPSRRSCSRNLASDFSQLPIEEETMAKAETNVSLRRSTRSSSVSRQVLDVAPSTPSRRRRVVSSTEGTVIDTESVFNIEQPVEPKPTEVETPTRRGRPMKIRNDVVPVEVSTPKRTRAASTSQAITPAAKEVTPSRRGTSVQPRQITKHVPVANELVVEDSEAVSSRRRSSSRTASSASNTSVAPIPRRSTSRSRKTAESTEVRKVYSDIEDALAEQAVDENGKKLRGRKLMNFSVEFKKNFKLNKNGNLVPVPARQRSASETVSGGPTPKKALTIQPTIKEEPEKVRRNRSRSATRVPSTTEVKSEALDVVDPVVIPKRRSVARASTTVSNVEQSDVVPLTRSTRKSSRHD